MGMMSAVVERIRAKGYWDVAIRPEPFRSALVQYDQLDAILNQVVVRFRGWPLPFIDYRQPFLRHQDWIGQDIDARNVSHEEAWRFFTSGQFTQLRVVSADRRLGAEATQVPVGATSVIEVWEILFYLTEVVELAARLALGEAGGDRMTIEVRLQGLENRLLVSGTPSRELHGDYRTSAPSIWEQRTLERAHLVAEPRRIAVGMSKNMFLRFGFNASEEVLTDYQQELTEGR
jgi:hypothetical protein